MARGCFPDSHPLCLGMPGMHGNYTAVTAMQRSDLLIALGSRFDDRVTGKIDAFAPERQDHPCRRRSGRAQQGAARRRGHRRRLPPGHRRAVGGPRRARSPSLRRHPGRVGGSPERRGCRRTGWCRVDWPRCLPRDRLIPWRAQLSEWQRRYPLVYDQQPGSGALKPQFVLETLPRRHPRRRHRGLRGRTAPDVRLPVVAVRLPLHLGQFGRPGHHGVRGACRRSVPRSADRTGWCGRWTATAASR